MIDRLAPALPGLEKRLRVDDGVGQRAEDEGDRDRKTCHQPVEEWVCVGAVQHGGILRLLRGIGYA